MAQQEIKKSNKLIYLIIGLAALLRFWNFLTSDIYSDGTGYAFRALGWFDYLGGGLASPLNWFQKVPAWAHLSFTDSPPLNYFVQNIFFKVFGYSLFALRFPFILAGIGTVILAYLILKECNRKRAALWAALLVAISAASIWNGLSAYLEGLEVFFITLVLYMLIRYIKKDSIKNLYFLAISAGLAFLSKYTSIFVLMTVITYILIWKRELFRKKELYKAIILFFIILTPIIIYNIMVFYHRGHLDVALGAMIGMHSKDDTANGAINYRFDILASLNYFYNTVISINSLGLVVLGLVSVLSLIYKFIKKNSDKIEKIALLTFIFWFLSVIFSGSTTHRFPIIIPTIAVIIGLLIDNILIYFEKNKRLPIKIAIICLLAFVYSWELVYAFNSNIMPRPFGNQYLHTDQPMQNFGWNQLDNYLRKNAIIDLPNNKNIENLSDVQYTSADINGRNVIIYDDTVNWYTYCWYIEPYIFYYRYPYFSLLSIIGDPSKKEVGDPFQQLRQAGAKGFYFYIAEEGPGLTDAIKLQDRKARNAILAFASSLEKNGIKPVEIRNVNNDLAFKVYYFK